MISGIWYGVRPRPDWLDVGEFNEDCILWTQNERLAHSIVRVFYHNMAEVVDDADPEFPSTKCKICGVGLQAAMPRGAYCPACE